MKGGSGLNETSRQNIRRQQDQQRRDRRKKSLWFCLVFILAAFLLNWTLIIQTRNPNVRQQKGNQPLTTATHLFTSTALNQHLQSSWKKAVHSSDANVSIAIYSSKTGDTYTYSNVSNQHNFHTASTIKVAVLASVLAKNDGELDSRGRALAKNMIEHSDNDSTTALISDYLGGTKNFQQQVNKFQMTNTHIKYAWGMSTTTPSDQVKLLNNIFFKPSSLSDSSREYIQSLMENVESDQQWGISAGSNDFAIKNGWLSTDSGKWIINSIGYIDGPGDNNYTIAVYTDGNPSMKSGVKLVEKIARATHNVMKSEN